MTTMVDCYSLLGVARTASLPDIRSAHKRETTNWRKRAHAPSDSSTREEAEVRLKQLREALDVLANTVSRADYDDRLARTEPTMSQESGARISHQGSWLEQAQAYLGLGDYGSAVYAAQEATRETGNSADSWLLLSRANYGLRRLDEALYEAKRAVEISATPADSSARFHFHYGCIAEDLGRWGLAIAEYAEASRLEPSEPVCQLGIGSVLLQQGLPLKALSVMTRVYEDFPDDVMVKLYYAQTLLAAAEDVPKDKSTDGYAVTSADEIRSMRVHLARISDLGLTDQEVDKMLRAIETYLKQMESHTLSMPLAAREGLGLLVSISDGGCVSSMVVIFLATALLGLPLLLIFGGLQAIANGAAGGGFIALLLGVGTCYVWYKLTWIPRWKVNARRRQGRLRFNED